MALQRELQPGAGAEGVGSGGPHSVLPPQGSEARGYREAPSPQTALAKARTAPSSPGVTLHLQGRGRQSEDLQKCVNSLGKDSFLFLVCSSSAGESRQREEGCELGIRRFLRSPRRARESCQVFATPTLRRSEDPFPTR